MYFDKTLNFILKYSLSLAIDQYLLKVFIFPTIFFYLIRLLKKKIITQMLFNKHSLFAHQLLNFSDRKNLPDRKCLYFLQENQILQYFIQKKIFQILYFFKLFILILMPSDKDIKDHASAFGAQTEQELNRAVKAYKTNDYQLISDIMTPKNWQNFRKKVGIKQQIHSRFQPTKIHPLNTKEKSVQAVIIGPCGNGKTCLINHICGSDLGVGSSKSSLTRNVTQLPAQFTYSPQFILYDTPGTTSLQAKLEHAIFIKQILTWKPINTVFILVKYDTRFDNLIKTIQCQVQLLKGYESSIVFLVSHFDLVKDQKTEIDTINKMLNELEIKNNIVYFSNNSVDERDLCDKLYAISASMPKQKINIDQDSFLKNYNLTSQKGQEIFFEKHMKNSYSQMEEVTIIYADYALSLPNTEQRQAILQDLQVQLKNQLIRITQKFRQKFKQTMVGCNFYTSYYTLQKKCIDQMAVFQNKIRSHQAYKLIESQATGSMTDIRDLIKQCPNCKLIWFRIQACPNTVCGNRPSCFFDFLRNPFANYKIKRDGKKISYSKSSKENNIKTNQQMQNLWKGVHSNSRELGCKQAMNFETLPRLVNIEQILMEWYNVGSMSEVINKFQMDQELEKTRKGMEDGIRNYFSSFKY